jgi:gluconokinase
MLADVFDREVIVPESFESSCFGAAMLGLYALGEMKSLDEVAALIGATHRHVPEAKAAAVYARLAPIFVSLPRQLEAQYRDIAAFQRDAG